MQHGKAERNEEKRAAQEQLRNAREEVLGLKGKICIVYMYTAIL